MVSLTMALMYLLVFNFAIFGFTTAAIQIPGVRNPLCDFYPGYCLSGGQTGLVAGTINGLGDPNSITHAQQQVQSCGIAGIIGGTIGLLGFIAGPVGIATTIGGGVLGCAVAATFFPAQGANLFQQATNSLGPLGDVLKAVVYILQFAQALTNFVSDTVNYELALYTSAPELGVWLFPLQAVSMIMIAYEVMRYFRGIALAP